MSTPLSWMWPVSCDSRSMLATPFWPRNVRAVIREGRPKLNSPKSSPTTPVTSPPPPAPPLLARAPRDRAARLRRPVVRLHDQVTHLPEPGGQLLLVAHHPAAVLDDLRHGRAVEVAKLLALAGGADKAGISNGVLRGARDLHVEVCLDLEHLPELFVIRREQEVGQRLARR